MFFINKDQKGNNLLREYSFFLIDIEFKPKRLEAEYEIWSNDFIISQERKAIFFHRWYLV